MYERVHGDCLKLMNALGYDFGTLEFAVRDGIPYAIDFLNPAPDAAVESVGEENFQWVLEHAAKWLIERVAAGCRTVRPTTAGPRSSRAANGRAEARVRPRPQAGRSPGPRRSRPRSDA